jgi:hypothetical protein
LTITDTILSSDLFNHLLKGCKGADIYAELHKLEKSYKTLIKKSKEEQELVINDLPKEWNVPAEIVKEKIRQLFDDNWIEECWKNFVECLNNNRNEK